jgi:hypothetical protein
VWCDDEEVKTAVTADEAMGEVWYLPTQTRADGEKYYSLRVNADGTRTPIMAVRKGRVRVAANAELPDAVQKYVTEWLTQERKKQRRERIKLVKG